MQFVTKNPLNNTLGDESSRLQGNLHRLGETWRDDAYERFTGYFDELMANLRRFQQLTEKILCLT